MPRRTLANRNVRKLFRNAGGTTVVSLPKEFIKSLGWRSKQKVVVKKSGKRLIIEDWKE